MDILRAALASSENAKAAVDFICRFTEGNAQGGNGAYKGHLVYNNSYIVASSSEAYVVETAGHRWAWREIHGIGSISNAYSIEEDYTRLDPQTRKEIAPVNEQAACSDEADAGRKGHKESWRAHVESRFYLLFTRGDIRKAASYAALEAARGRIDASTIFGILRSHGAYDLNRPRRRNMESLCIHPGAFPVDSATTASFAVEYLPDDGDASRAILWFTATAYPCLSIYKPILLDRGRFIPLWRGYEYAEDSEAAREHWERQNRWMRATRAHAFSKDSGFAARRDEAQARIVEAAAQAAAGADVETARSAVDGAVTAWYAGLVGW
jgi:secernin